MKKAKNGRQFTNLIAVLILILGVVPFAAAASFTAVYADGEEGAQPVETPPVEQVSADEEVAEEVVEETGPVEDLAEDTDPAGEETPVEEAVELAEEVETEVVEEEVEDLSELVEVLSEENVEVVNESGEALPLASQETADILASTDPFFWNGSEWVGYTETGTGCPANVTCFASTTPFQDAVTQAGTGNTVYVASGNYDEDVVIDDANMSLVAFHSITVPDNAAPVVTVESSGYAVVRSITLNADLLLNDGVYADYVIVNELGQTGGRLDDAMTLVNDGGRIEADVVIYGADGHYRVKDKNHPEVNFEWECGEPNEVIYPGRTYRMTLMNPLDQTIIDYYTDHGDERNAAPWNLDLTALERMEDLQIAVNVSEDYGPWGHNDEERIYWYLVGNTGKDNNNRNITLTSSQQDKADAIVNGDWNDVTRFWGIWFMYPTLESGGTEVGVDNRQLTFFVYDPRPVFGCIDPEAENYDPNADTDDESCEYRTGCMDPDALNYDPDAVRGDDSCRYEDNTETPPQFLPDPLPIPVTGEEEFLIPVTGVDGIEENGAKFEIAIALLSVMLVGGCVIFFNKRKELTN